MRSSLVGVLITKRARRLEVRKHRSAANDARQAERSRRGIPRCGSLRVGGAQHELWGPASPGRSKPQACACPTGSSTACASRCGPRLRRRCIAELRVRGSVRGSDRRQNGATNRRHYSLEFGLSTAIGGTAPGGSAPDRPPEREVACSNHAGRALFAPLAVVTAVVLFLVVVAVLAIFSGQVHRAGYVH